MDPLSDYLKTLRSDSTRETYTTTFKLVVGDGNRFLDEAKKDRKKAEDELIEYIVSSRGRIRGSTIATRLAELKSFLDFYEVPLNWKRVKSAAPKARMVGADRPPTVQEIRTLLKFADVRDKAIVLCMASSGIRVGALPGLNVEDLSLRPSGTGVLSVYRGEPDQYPALVSPEAVQALDDYLDARRRIGEKVGPTSPLFRNRWDYRRLEPRRNETVTRRSLAPDLARRLNVNGVKKILDRLWIRCGLKVRHGKSEWKTAHGFRKFFKTQAERGGMQRDAAESLLGHFMPYYKPTLEHLEEEYLKALSHLAVDERFGLRVQLEAKDKTHESEWTKVRLRNLELTDELEEVKTGQRQDRETLEKILGLLRAGAKVDPALLTLTKAEVEMDVKRTGQEAQRRHS